MADTINPSLPPAGGYSGPFGTLSNSPNRVEDSETLDKTRATLVAELAKARFERDQYAKIVSHFMSKDYVCPYRSEELLAIVGTQPPLHELIAELEVGTEDQG